MTPDHPDHTADVRVDVLAVLRCADPGDAVRRLLTLHDTTRDPAEVVAFANVVQDLVADVHTRLDRGDRRALADAVDALTDRTVADAVARLET